MLWEGCVHQGLLSRPQSMNWSQQVTIPAEAVRKVNLLRSGIHILLWAGSNLPYPSLPIFLGIAALEAAGAPRPHNERTELTCRQLSPCCAG